MNFPAKCSKKIQKPSSAGPVRHTKNILLKSMFLKYKGSKLPKKNRPNIRVRAVKYQLQYLVKKTETFPKYFGTLITHMNYCFPTDLNFKPSNFGSKKSHFSQFFCQMSKSRISKIEYCQRKQIWTYSLEERCPESSPENDSQHLTSYLASLAYPDAVTIGKLLEKWVYHPKFSSPSQASSPTLLQSPPSSILTLSQQAFLQPPSQPVEPSSQGTQLPAQPPLPTNLPLVVPMTEETNCSEIKKNAYICMVEEYNYTESYRYKICAFKHNKL
jgi:hypothetical protein